MRWWVPTLVVFELVNILTAFLSDQHRPHILLILLLLQRVDAVPGSVVTFLAAILALLVRQRLGFVGEEFLASFVFLTG